MMKSARTQQECIPVGCVPPDRYRTETLTETFPGQRPPLDRDTPGQRPPRTETETPRPGTE